MHGALGASRATARGSLVSTRPRDVLWCMRGSAVPSRRGLELWRPLEVRSRSSGRSRSAASVHDGHLKKSWGRNRVAAGCLDSKAPTASADPGRAGALPPGRIAQRLRVPRHDVYPSKLLLTHGDDTRISSRTTATVCKSAPFMPLEPASYLILPKIQIP